MMDFIERIRTRAERRRREGSSYLGDQLLARSRKGICFAQDDLVVANASGAAVRSDMNSQFQALGTLMSGATAPATTYAHMLWADTTSGTLKRRNAANSGWLVVRTLDEAFVLSRSSNTLLDISDIGKVIRATANYTQTFDPVATLADSWWVGYRIESGVTITFDPNSSEQINGVTSLAITGPAAGLIYCTGGALFTIGLERVVDLVDETAPDVADSIRIYDTSAASDKRASITNFYKTINGLTEDTTPDAAADFVATYDASAGAGKKVKFANIPQNFIKLNSGTVSAAATLDIVLTSYTAYKTLLLKLEAFQPVNDDSDLWIRTSTNGGSSYDAAGTDYGYSFGIARGVAANQSSTGAAFILTTNSTGTVGIGNASTEALHGEIYLHSASSAALWTQVHWLLGYMNAEATSVSTATFGTGSRRTAADVDAIRLMFDTGNIASGAWTLYGLLD